MVVITMTNRLAMSEVYTVRSDIISKSYVLTSCIFGSNNDEEQVSDVRGLYGEVRYIINMIYTYSLYVWK